MQNYPQMSIRERLACYLADNQAEAEKLTKIALYTKGADKPPAPFKIYIQSLVRDATCNFRILINSNCCFN